VYGQKTYNGVAILSRVPMEDVRTGFGTGSTDQEARLISARINGVRFLSAYVPNGKVVGSDKWEYKQDWYQRLKAHLEAHYQADEPLVLSGDFNCAPEDRDVARPDEWRNSVLCDEPTRQQLRALMSWGFTDLVGLKRAETDPGPYTWWDYRMLGFAKGNGLRIDHILATKSMAARCTSAYVVREERKGKLPSDHAPVVAVFSD
jgi:exodeoxyribonuclease-3